MKSVDERNLSLPTKAIYQDPRLHLIFGVSLIAFMGIPSITPAFPKIVQALEVSPQRVGLIITAFTLPNVLLGPVLGVLADRVGRKSILMGSLALFSFAGMACALAPTFPALLAMRFLQGTGAAALIFLSVTLIGDFYTDRERTAALGYQASVISVGTASYPLLGGALATLGWNYPFLLAGLGLPVGVWVWLGLKEPKSSAPLQLRVQMRQAWQSIRERAFIGLFLSTITTFILLCGACATYLPLLMQQRFAVSLLTVGLFLSLLFATVTLTASQFSRWVQRYSPGVFIRFSFLLYAIALVLMPFMPTIGSLLLPILLYGIALGLGLPSLQSLITELTPPTCRAAVMSLNGAVLGLGQALGPILLGFAYGFWKLEGAFIVSAIFALGTFGLLQLCWNYPPSAIAKTSHSRNSL